VEQRLAQSVPAPASDDAVLVVSELVTNAVRAGAETCSVELQLAAESIGIVVFDDAPGSPHLAPADQLAEHGRGLPIVDALAQRWRVRQLGSGKQVEVELGVAGPGRISLPSSAPLFRNNVTVGGRPDGQPMLFAHGFGCDQQAWASVLRVFEHDHRVVAFDHVGFGRSDRSAWDRSRHASLSGYADDLLEIVEELDLHDVVFVGHSVSSMIGLLAANRAPDRFARLVLVGPSPRYLDDPDDGYVGGFTPRDIDGLLETLERDYSAWAAVMAPTIMGTPEQPELAEELREMFCRTDPEVAAVFARATFLADNRADLGLVRVPTLVLQCAEDVIAPDSVGRYVADRIPGSTFVRLSARGHCPNMSAPDETARAIRGYLDRAHRFVGS
jgi:sigma-B regulation protein RsbQ